MFKQTGIFLLTIALALAGCASEPYVVLLPNEDGSTGKVTVHTPQGETVLENAKQAVNLGDPAGQTFTVSEDQFQEDFAVAINASPMTPKTFLLYFKTGTSTLTDKSKADIPNIAAEIKKRPAPDMSVIGHTDTVDDASSNETLSLGRARAIADLMFLSTGLAADKIVVESHGEKNLLVMTPDNTDEPRNRRVEVTIR